MGVIPPLVEFGRPFIGIDHIEVRLLAHDHYSFPWPQYAIEFISNNYIKLHGLIISGLDC